MGGLALAVVLGVVTPFCSCSSIPLFIGFVAAGIPLSITLTFLIASPLVSEIAAIMIGDQFGWPIAAAYVAAGSVLSLVIGWIFSRFDLSRWVEDMVFATKVATLRTEGHVPRWPSGSVPRSRRRRTSSAACGCGSCSESASERPSTGGFRPTSSCASPDRTIPSRSWSRHWQEYPLYVNGAGVVPIAEALWAKGMSLGTVMAFTMSTIALSVPQAVMLRRVMKPPLLAVFFGTVAVGIMIIGFLFNSLADPPTIPPTERSVLVIVKILGPAAATATPSRSALVRRSPNSVWTPRSRPSPTTPDRRLWRDENPPGLVVDEEVLVAGKVPSVKDLTQLIAER